MTNGDPTPTPPNGGSPSSWRDVYTLIQDVERRLTARIDDVGKTAMDVARDHEGRLRQVELMGAPVAQVANAAAVANSLRITALEAASIIQNARAQGRNALFSNGQKLVATTVIICNFALGAIVLLHVHP